LSPLGVRDIKEMNLMKGGRRDLEESYIQSEDGDRP